MAKVDDEKQSIDKLKTRYDELNRKKIEASTHLENAEKQLKKLKEKALNEYGTDDIDELKNILKQRIDDNETKKSDYQKHLDDVENNLAEIEAKYRESKQ